MVKEQKRLTLKEWPDEDKPREKMMLKGPQALSDAELIAILLRAGTKEFTAVDIARQLLEKTDFDLNKLGEISPKKLKNLVKGIGSAKAITISAALEIGRRRKEISKNHQPQKVSSSRDAYDYIYPYLADQQQEMVYVILLNRANMILSAVKVSEGGITGTVVDVKVVFRKVLDEAALSMILVHNHPSGNNQPSQQDIELTAKIKDAAKFLEVSLLDHLIFTNNSYFSFADEGLL